ncbi:MAG: polyhydroxyalkanoate depolymerase, partial [Aquabacterium commune]|uniref:polyhydroxyalkanoate depolymerase n=2 Tax=Aquabacterium TaxID=92793 RepID=UPI003BB220D4
KLYSNPLSALAQIPSAHRVSAGFDLVHRLTKEYEKPEFGINKVHVDGTEVVIQEQVVEAKPFCRLIRFKRFTDNGALLDKMRHQPSVLVVAPLSGHHSTLLRDTVRTLLQDHKVYITDWIDARMVSLEDGAFHLDDYINYVQDFIRKVGPDVHVISVCQPTVPVLAAVSLMASRGEATPRTMVMMGGPIDARRSPTAVNNLAMNKSFEWFENNVIYRVPPNYPGAGRRVYPGFLQHTGFVAMNPDRHATSHYDYFLDLVRGDDDSAESHRQFYDEYNAVLDMPAEYYLDTIKTVFQDFALVNGTWKVRNPKGKEELVKPADIKTTALLTVEGELDDISGAGQTKAAHELCTGIPKTRQKHYDVVGAGHYGIFSGRRWREKAYPEIRAFILSHNK